jgi:predicted RNase H-like HicB family nuclease
MRATMPSLRIPIRVVFYLDEADWVAHCLEFGLLGDGPTKEQALEELLEAIRLQIDASIKYNNPSNLFSPADGKYFEMFAAGRDVAEGELTLHFESTDGVTIESIQAREYAEAELASA